MPGERLLRILALVSSSPDEGQTSARLCEVAAQATQMTGAGIMLMSGSVARGSLCSSNAVSALIEDLQFTLGEGPCVDAYALNRPVLEVDLADPDPARWLAFSPPAIDAGVRAIFGFPLQVGTQGIGALNLYRDRPGALSADQLADSLVVADVVARSVMSMQADASSGEVAEKLESGSNLRFVVHQASGMVSVQLGISVAEALARMRAYAFGNDQVLDDVAKDVVARRMRFDHSDDELESPT